MLGSLAAAGSAVAADLPIRVVTSIPPLAMLVSELGGDRVLVHSILPPGADPHTFEPRPSDAAAVANADVIVSFGSSIDDWLGDVLAASDGAGIVRLDPEATGQAGDHGDECDPHVWLDPLWVREHAIAPIHRALAAADPEGAPRYGVSARAMSEEMSDLEAEVREELALASTRSFLAWHPAWNRFAARFDLHPVGALGESEGREPSLRTMIAAVRLGRAAGVRAVLVEPQTDGRHARVLADELGVPLVTVDPLGSAWSLDRATYASLLRFNVHAFEQALAVVKPEEEAPVSAIPAPQAVR